MALGPARTGRARARRALRRLRRWGDRSDGGAGAPPHRHDRRLLAALTGSADDQLTRLHLADLRLRAGHAPGARRELDAVRAVSHGEGRDAAFALLADAAGLGVELVAGSVEDAAHALDRLERGLAALGPEASGQHGAAAARAVAVTGHALVGDAERARTHLRVAHDDAVATRDGPILAAVATAAARVARSAGDDALAGRLVGAGRRLRGAEDAGDPLHAALVLHLRASPGEAYEEERARGAHGTREQAVAVLAGAVAALSGGPARASQR